MADSWTLTTPSGPYTLNASFSAPKYQAGGVGPPGALRRDDRNTYQRSGDGLPTPGALTLTGRVWRDDQNAALIVTELNAIKEAVAACSEVVRTTAGGTYTYSGIAGGPTPEVTPDGLGGWLVTIELWPARANATFIPASGRIQPIHFASRVNDIIDNQAVVNFGPPGASGELELLFCTVRSHTSLVNVATPDGWTFALRTANAAPAYAFVFWRIVDTPAATVTLNTAYATEVSWAFARYSATANPFAPIIAVSGVSGSLTTPIISTPAPVDGTWVGYWFYARGLVDEPNWTAPAGGTSRTQAHSGVEPWASSFLADGAASGSTPGLTANPGRIVDDGSERQAVIVVLDAAY